MRAVRPHTHCAECIHANAQGGIDGVAVDIAHPNLAEIEGGRPLLCARENTQAGEVRSNRAGNFQRGVAVAHGDHQHDRLFSAGRVQQVEPRGVTEVHLEHDRARIVGPQQPSPRTPELSEPCENHRALPLHRIVCADDGSGGR